MKEQLAKDLTCASDLRLRDDRQGSADRIIAMACIAAKGAREAQMEALGAALWAYKLPWQAPKEVPQTLRDECEATGRARQQHGRIEAAAILLRILENAKRLEGFGGQGQRLFAMLKVAEQAIEEHVNDLCRHCNGAGELKREDETLLVTCPVCHGHRKHRYSDDERAEALNVPKFDMPKWNKALEAAHDILGTADRAMAQRMGQWLGRDE